MGNNALVLAGIIGRIERTKKFLGIVEKTPMSFCTTNLEDKNERISSFKGAEKMSLSYEKSQ